MVRIGIGFFCFNTTSRIHFPTHSSQEQHQPSEKSALPAEIPGSAPGGKAPFEMVSPDLQKQTRASKVQTCTRGRKRASSKIWGDQAANPKKRKGSKARVSKVKAKSKRSLLKRSGSKTKNASGGKATNVSGSEILPKKDQKKPKASAKCKASAKSKAAKAKAEKTPEGSERHTGCSRCRYAAKGCKTCLNPAFRPRGPRKTTKCDASKAVDVD